MKGHASASLFPLFFDQSVVDAMLTSSSATRAETTADTLRQAIKEGRYMGGERLIEQTLAGKLNVSQNTIRDALRILEGEGWVVKAARHGVYVRSFNKGEAEELYALWAAVEGLALAWVIQSLSKNALAHLRRLIQDARKQALMGDARAAAESLMALHATIASLSGRAQTMELLASLHNRVHLLEVLRQMRSPRSPHAQQTHIILYEKLVSLMEAGDADAARQLHEYLIMDECSTLLPLLG
jgi:DNA-binding GntR family transcriptional regulator